MSIPTQAALTHLRTIRPNDGWAARKNDKGVRLLRRNVPVSDNYFLDLHYDSVQNLVVGVLTHDGSSCQVLVDERGKPVSEIRIGSVSTYDPKSAKNVSFAKSRAAASTSAPARTNTNNTSTGSQRTFTDEENREIVKYALMFLGVCIIAKILGSSSAAGLYLIFLPLLYLYAVQTCPSMESFDAKKELKRVLRGHHLPEDHPDKPRGLLEQWATRLAASVTAELATFPGYEATMTSLGGAAWLADVRVPTAKTQCYWVGAFGKWRYIASREIPDRHYD